MFWEGFFTACLVSLFSLVIRAVFDFSWEMVVIIFFVVWFISYISSQLDEGLEELKQLVIDRTS